MLKPRRLQPPGFSLWRPDPTAGVGDGRPNPAFPAWRGGRKPKAVIPEGLSAVGREERAGFQFSRCDAGRVSPGLRAF